MKIGFIQSLGIGDIIIALPIAKYFVDQGHTVLWPINQCYVSHFTRSVPYVEFIGIPEGPDMGWFFEEPLRILKERGCDRIAPLYNALKVEGYPVNRHLAGMLKFDEYKYAVAGVPFLEKWTLDVTRDAEREARLFDRVVTGRNYVVAHLQGSSAKAHLDTSVFLTQYDQVIEIADQTDCVFDWLKVIENASYLVMIDSCFANMVDQLRIGVRKGFIRRSELARTPVLGSGWEHFS